MKFISLDYEDSWVIATIDRPEKLNALSIEVLTELKSLLIALGKSQDADGAKDGRPAKGMILTGRGEKAFVAGADIKEQAAMNMEQAEAFGFLGQEVTTLMEALPFPVIACVNGFALGGGCELAMSCDFIYATAKACFGQPEVNLGLIPGFGGCVRLKRYVGTAMAKELIYTGRHLSAGEAHQAGLVNRLFETNEEMMNAARTTLALISSKSSPAVRLCKEVLTSIEGLGTTSSLKIERAAFRKAFETEDMRIGVTAFLAKASPQFVGR
jgi:enoyl-CoA hydratase